jgi:hypothetical protein
LKKIFIFNLLLLTSFVAIANDGEQAEQTKYQYETSCSSMEYIINGMNEKLPQHRQINMDCEETSDSYLWGTVKSNFQASISLTSSIPLCKNAEQSYRKLHVLGHGANIGISTVVADNISKLLSDHSIDINIGASGSNVGTMYNIKTVQFPYCD